jgi:PBP1b-binding outer membrane lipoprotein LpoB
MLKNTFNSFSLLIALLFLSGCIPRSEENPMTQLQTREIQTREFDTADSKLVMKSMMNVLQDEGFLIKNAVLDLGLISAEKNIDIENKFQAFLCAMNQGVNARWNKQQILEASANVSEYGCKTRVRMNFQMKTIDNHGCPQDVKTLLDGEYYCNFFEKVSKGIFLQQEIY